MDATIVLFAILLALLMLTWYESRNGTRIAKYVNKIPGYPIIPIVGTSWSLMFVRREDLLELSKRRFRKFGAMFRTWFGSLPVVHLSQPDHAERILNNSTNITKSESYNALRPWLGDGLLTSTGRKWHLHRKLITPAFHFKILDNCVDMFVEKTQILIEQLGREANGRTFDIYPYITHCALEIICETAMGVHVDSMSNPSSEYVQSVYGISELSTQRILKPWLHSDIVFYRTKRGKMYKRYLNILHEFTQKVIDERKIALSKQENNTNKKADESICSKKRMAFLDLLLESSKNGMALTDSDIREEVDTFMFEGHDTTTAGICWTLFLLGHHLDIQEKVFDEINRTLGKNGEYPSIRNLGKLKLLERCIKEALRLYPSVPIISRLLSEDIQTEEYLLPAGCTINLHISILHRNEEMFPKAENFDPDRFLPENIKCRHPYAYIPFSAGPRNCIGQKFAMLEEKIILAYILTKFKITAIDTREEVKPMLELILRPLNGMRVILEART